MISCRNVPWHARWMNREPRVMLFPPMLSRWCFWIDTHRPHGFHPLKILTGLIVQTLSLSSERSELSWAAMGSLLASTLFDSPESTRAIRANGDIQPRLHDILPLNHFSAGNFRRAPKQVPQWRPTNPWRFQAVSADHRGQQHRRGEGGWWRGGCQGSRSQLSSRGVQRTAPLSLVLISFSFLFPLRGQPAPVDTRFLASEQTSIE